jgi:hypothetical protein
LKINFFGVKAKDGLKYLALLWTSYVTLDKPLYLFLPPFPDLWKESNINGLLTGLTGAVYESLYCSCCTYYATCYL